MLAPLVLAGSFLILKADTCEAFPPSSSFRFRSKSSLSRASVPLGTFEAIDIYTSTTIANRRCSDIYRCPTKIYSSSAANHVEEADIRKRGIRPHLKELFLLCRPINLPIVFLFHVLGVQRAVEFWKTTMLPVSASSPSMLSSILIQPSMMMVLLSLILVTSTSMITNDYYDAKNGVDIAPEVGDESATDHYHPLAKGEIPFSVTKTFVSYLYAILLLSSAFLPGTIPRLMVIAGAITTYLYTVHLKPKTWIKNISCAALVAMSPITSGLAAWQVMRDTTAAKVSSSVPYALIFNSPLTFLVISLFAGIMCREILMDITDCEGDARAGIETLPVKYGKEVASRIALGWSIVSCMSACGESLTKWIPLGVSRLMSISSGVDTHSLTGLTARKVILSTMGGGWFAQKTYKVWRAKGDDAVLAEQAVRDGFLGVLLVLVSFM